MSYEKKPLSYILALWDIIVKNSPRWSVLQYTQAIYYEIETVRSQLLIGFHDTGKRTQLSCLGVPAGLTVILSSEYLHSFIHSFV